jgi:hypothetical protein
MRRQISSASSRVNKLPRRSSTRLTPRDACPRISAAEFAASRP